MKCLKCDTEVESDDNFCPKCGHWTAKGFTFYNKTSNVDMLNHSLSVKKQNRLSTLIILLTFMILLFIAMIVIRGDDLFRPYVYLKKQIYKYTYGYNTTIIKTDNKYHKQNINSYEESVYFIEKDFKEQKWQCYNHLNVSISEYDIQKKYSIPSVSFCDISLEEVEKIKMVIDKMYSLFPNIKGALTNITITNEENNSNYIAYFQPMYQFVNMDEDISLYNKVNKTQILLNSYYFLDEEKLSKKLEEVVGVDFYVKDATWESTIAHELGHYISFVILLKKYNLQNITFVNKENNEKIKEVLEIFDSGNFSKELVIESLNNYNLKYKKNVNIKEFASSISKYAGNENKNGEIIYDEIIAEAIHDYYLHGNNMNSSSAEIVRVIKNNL